MNIVKWASRRLRKSWFKYLYVCSEHNDTLQFEKGFCAKCGRPLVRVDNAKNLCPVCGWAVLDNFCPKCGWEKGEPTAKCERGTTRKGDVKND